MTKSTHFLAVLPLLSILSLSPAHLEEKASRSIASIEEVKSVTPKYDARAGKIDREALEKDAELDMTKFSAKADAFREKLQLERKQYMIDLCEKEAVAAQKKRVEDLVKELVALEEDSKAVKEKGLLEEAGKEIHDKSMNELKITLESILQDEIEHELVVAKERLLELEAQQKPQETQEEKTPVVAEEEKKKTKEEELICELEEKNKLLSKQVEDLMKQQQQIMQTMLGMNQMMVQMNQSMQQNTQQIPSWMMAGSLMNPTLQYPTLPMVPGTYVVYPQAYMPQPSITINNGFSSPFSQGEMGQQTMQQGAKSPEYQLPNYLPHPAQDPRFVMPEPHIPGTFGGDPYMFNFGPSQFGQLPIRTA